MKGQRDILYLCTKKKQPINATLYKPFFGVSFPPSPITGSFIWDLLCSFLSLSSLGLSVTDARVQGPDAERRARGWVAGLGRPVGCYDALGGVITIAAPCPLEPLTSTG